MPTFESNDFYISDANDQTKLLTFDVSALPTATLRTLVVPWTPASGSHTMALADYQNNFSVGQTFQSRIRVENADDADVAIRLDQTGSTIGALVITDYLGAQKIYVDKYGYFQDAYFSIDNATDQTKVFRWDAAGISPATTRTLAVPNASGVIALDTSILCYDGDVVTYEDDLVSI